MAAAKLNGFFLHPKQPEPDKRNIQIEQLNNALLSLKQLRCSVGQVFDNLSFGVRSERTEENEQKFQQEFQDLFNSVNSNLRETESVIGNLPAMPTPFNLGNSAYLSQENSLERQALYPQLINCYKWVDKVHDYSFLANNLLNSNSLRRSYISSSNKRSRLPVSSTNTSVTTQHLDKLINESFNSIQTNFRIFRPFGTNAIVIVNIGRTLKAAILFKGVLIEWVTIRGYDEHLEVEDLWTESKYEVYRKVQEQTHSAMLHFFSPTLPDLAIKSFMTWICSYAKLFSEPCRKCGKHLNSGMPPTWRDVRTLEPYHEECRNC